MYNWLMRCVTFFQMLLLRPSVQSVLIMASNRPPSTTVGIRPQTWRPNLPKKHHSVPIRGKESGGGLTEMLKLSQQNKFASSPLNVNFEDLSNANSSSSSSLSESQYHGIDEDDDDLHPLKEGLELKAFTSVRSDSISTIDASPCFLKQQSIPEESKENETADQDAQHDDILSFCADEIAAGAAGSTFNTPQSTPSISPSHTPTLTRTPTPQGTTAHVAPIHPVAMQKNSGNSSHFTYQVSFSDSYKDFLLSFIEPSKWWRSLCKCFATAVSSHQKVWEQYFSAKRSVRV